MTQPSGPARWRERFRRPALIAYALILCIATLIPFNVDATGAHVAERISRALHPTLEGRDVVDGARNVVLFAGWGVVWALTAAGGVRRIIVQATLSGAAISTVVELIQLFSSNRITSLIDVSTNTIGAFIGAVILIIMVALAAQQRAARSYVGIPALFFAAAYGGATLFETLIPLFRQLDTPIAYGDPFTRFSASAATFSFHSITELTISDFVIFLPAGALAVMALAETGMPHARAQRVVIVWGTLLALIGEVLHGLLGQPMLIGAFLTHALAIGAGAWLAARYLSRLSVLLRGQQRPRALAVVYALALLAWSWRPFLPETEFTSLWAKLSAPWYVPLAALSGRVDFFSVADVCAQFLLYVPLGGLLAIWPLRNRGALGGPLPAVWLAFILEAGQLFIWQRTPDVTIPLIQASGAVIGYAIVQRAGYRVYGEILPARR